MARVRAGRFAQQCALPERVIGVLNGQRRQLRVLACGTRLPAEAQILQQRQQGATIPGGMVNEQQQNMLLRCQLIEPGFNRQFAIQRKEMLALHHQLRFKVLGRDGEGRQRKLDVVSRKDLLAGHLFLLG